MLNNLQILLASLITSSIPQLSAISLGTDHVSEQGNIFYVDQEFAAEIPPDREYTGFSFSSIGGFSFEYQGSFLDEGVSVFLVNPNDEFFAPAILTGDFTELTFGVNYSLPSNFFLGLVTPIVGFEPVALDKAYGWVEIQNPGTGELSVVDHAMAYGSTGIVVNTLTAIPEPSSAVLFGLGLLGLSSRRRRSSRP